MKNPGKTKAACLFAGLVALTAACGSSDDETVPTEEPDKIYICRQGEPCDNPGIWCHYDPTDPASGLLTCTGTEFVTSCEEGYYCNFDGSTPGLWPRCLDLNGTILTCDPDDFVLYIE